MIQFSKLIITSLFLVSNIQLAQAHSTKSYSDELSIEADQTSMKPDGSAIINNEDPEPIVTPAALEDINALSKEVANHLEQILTGASSKVIKQKKITHFMTNTSKKGYKINTIQNAVNLALKDLNNQKNHTIQPESLDLARQTIDGIIQTNKTIAQDDLIDPYIKAINAEEEETFVIDKTKPAINQNTKYRKTRLTQPNIQTIIVQKNDTLYKISKKIYGSPYKSTLLFEANRDVLTNNPDLLEVGQVLKVPRLLHLP